MRRKKSSPRQNTLVAIHQKKRKLANLKAQLENLKKKSPSLIFGGKKLWQKQFDLSSNGYSSHQDWKEDWQAARSSNFMLVGSSDEKCGNQICQLSSNGELKIRVPSRLEALFGKYVDGGGIIFPYGQPEIESALVMGKVLTWRFTRKNNKWYINCTVDVADTPIVTDR